jgi:single-strand DNA-binding protein
MAIGNLGNDPETRYVPSGAQLTTFSIGVSESWTDKNTGEQKESTEWMNIETWGKLAEICSEYLTKGKQVYVEGNLKTDSWEDKDTGKKMYRAKIRANSVLMLGGKREGEPTRTKPAATPPQEDFDDDIPF